MVATLPIPLHLAGDEDNSKRRKFSTAPARCSWISGLTAPAWAKSPAPPASPRGRCMFILPTRAGCSEADRRGASARTGQGAFNFAPERDVGTTLRDFGQAYIESMCRPGGGSAIRTVMAIASGCRMSAAAITSMCWKKPSTGSRFLEAHVKPTILRSTTASWRRRNSC